MNHEEINECNTYFIPINQGKNLNINKNTKV